MVCGLPETRELGLAVLLVCRLALVGFFSVKAPLVLLCSHCGCLLQRLVIGVRRPT